MPTNLSVPSNSTLKRLRLIAILLLFPLFFFGQTLTGLWTGALSNDSSTVRKDQLFEIALTEYKGKVYGYSRSEFIVDDTLYYMVKRVKGTIDGDICEVTDDEIISYNFRGKLDKGIKVTSIFRRNQNDSAWYLDGTWKTNATKKYYSVTGKVSLEEEKDLTASKIFPHLEELKLANDIAFYKDRQEGAPIVKMVKPEKIKTEYATKPGLTNDDISITANKPRLERATATPPVITTSTTVDDAANKPVNTPDVSTTINPVEKDTGVTPVKKVTDNVAKTDTKDVAISTGDITPPSSVGTGATNKTTATEATDQKKPGGDLSKNDTRVSTTDPVAITASSSPAGTAKNTVDAEDPATISKAAANLPTTDSKNLVSNKLDVTPSSKTGTAPVTTKNNITTAPKVTDNKPVKTGTVTTTPDQQQVVAKNNTSSTQQKQTDTRTIAKNNTPPIVSSVKPVAETNKQDVISKNTATQNSVAFNNPVTGIKDTKTTAASISLIPEEKKPVVDIVAKAALVAGRKSEFSQIVSFKADSLELSLYDNGEIDGDTVSIFMNGEVILSKQGLKASAIKKTIYITPGNEDFTLVLFAENLGKYPPNTGLLVVHDGEDVYNLRFSSDFQKNAGIVFRRKK